MDDKSNAQAAGEADKGAIESGQAQGNYNTIDQKSVRLLTSYPCCFLKSKPNDPKAPDGTNWPNNPRSSKEWRPGTGIGVICGLPDDNGISVQAVDVDTPHSEMAADLLAFIRPLLAKRSGHKLIRIGNPPKFLIPYKTKDPKKKQTSDEVFPITADGEIDTRREVKNQIEILGTGQQFVAYQIHPATGQPYQWESLTGEDPQTLYDAPIADLVELTPDDIESILWAFDELSERHGLQSKKPKQSNLKKVEPLERQSVADLLSWIPNNDDDYDSWFNVLAAIKHESGEAGREDAYQWSRKSSKHDEGKFNRTWDSIQRADGRTIGTLIWMAKQNGMPGKRREAISEPLQSPEPTHWPVPADLFSEHIVPAFPMDILPESFRELADEKSQQSGFDPGAYGFGLFVAASNTIDHRAKLDLGPFSTPAYQWAGLVGDSGTAKSPILNDAKRSAEHIDKALLDESRKALSNWMNACQRAKEDKAEMPPKPPWKQRHATDTTTEALGLLLVDNAEGVNMYHHEITEFIGRMDAYSGKDGGKDRGVYLRSYDGGYVTINRAGRAQPLVIDNFSVGILAGIQPEKLAYLFKKSGGGSDGLYQRFLMYCLQPAGEVDYMAKESPFTQSNVNMVFERIHNWIGAESVSARLSDPAKRMMQDYHNNIRKLATRTAAQRFAEHLNKFPGMLGRTAFALHLIHAAANDEQPSNLVEKDIMAMAIKFMRVMYRHSEAVYRVLDQEAGDVRALVVSAAEAVLSKSWDTFKRGDLTRNATYWQGADTRQSENAIDYLIELGWIADVTPPAMPGRRGRRSDGIYAVNPDVHSRYKAQRERITEARAERFKAIQAAAG